MHLPKAKNLGIGALVIAWLIGLGFLRDFIFVNINFQLYKLWYGEERYELPPSLKFLERWEPDSLYYLKFPLTAFTILIFFLTSHFTIRYFFKERKYLLLNLAAHGVFCLIGGLFYLYGILSPDYNTGYHFSRIFLDFVQSPLLLMIVLPACKLLENR